MNKILDGIRSQVGKENLIDSCREDKCKVYMTDVPFPRVLVDADLAFPAHDMKGKRCDYVLFFIDTAKDTLVTVPMELKSGDVKASKASKQLQQGAKFAERFTKTALSSICHPVLFHHKRIHPWQRKELNEAKVSFCGNQLTIKTARCNHPGNLARSLSS